VRGEGDTCSSRGERPQDIRLDSIGPTPSVSLIRANECRLRANFEFGAIAAPGKIDDPPLHSMDVQDARSYLCRDVSGGFVGDDNYLAGKNAIWVLDLISVRIVDDWISLAPTVTEAANAP
jgi:hypothetical protein